MPRRFTDAPEAYDGFGTTTEVVYHDMRTRRGPVRVVNIPGSALEWQALRYASGMHLCVSAEKWAEIWDLVVTP